MRKIIIPIIVVLAIGGFFMLKEKNVTTALDTTIIKVEERTIESNIFLNGTVVTEEMRDIIAESNEVINQINVKIGDVVKKGDVLAIQNTDELTTQIKASHLQIEIENIKLAKLKAASNTLLVNERDSAKLSYEDTESKMANEKELFDEGITSQQQYNASVLAYESAKNQYQNAQYRLNSSSYETDLLLQEKAVEALNNDLDKLEKKLDKAQIVANIDGTVTELNGIVGERANGVLFTIANFEKNIIKTQISEGDINKIEIGQPVIITANAIKNEIFTGKVTWISPDSKKLEGKKQAYVEVKVELDEVQTKLRRNFSVNLKVQVANKENVIAVKFEGIKTKSTGESFVSKKNADGTTEDITIQTGIEGEVYVEVIGDQIKIGDEILIDTLPAGYGESESIF